MSHYKKIQSAIITVSVLIFITDIIKLKTLKEKDRESYFIIRTIWFGIGLEFDHL